MVAAVRYIWRHATNDHWSGLIGQGVNVVYPHSLHICIPVILKHRPNSGRTCDSVRRLRLAEVQDPLPPDRQSTFPVLVAFHMKRYTRRKGEAIPTRAEMMTRSSIRAGFPLLSIHLYQALSSVVAIKASDSSSVITLALWPACRLLYAGKRSLSGRMFRVAVTTNDDTMVV